jgi:magnesium-protoporphyrin O-methyltransferase
MPPSCCTPDYDAQFDEKSARHDLLTYRRDGPDPSTKRLIDALRREGVEGATLLDIGAGVGAVQLELLAAGAASAVDVDASAAYLSPPSKRPKPAAYGGACPTCTGISWISPTRSRLPTS